MKPWARLLSLILFPILLVNCGVVLKDTEWCGDKGQLGASCFHTISDGHRWVGPNEWDKERFGDVCTDSKNFAEWKKDILQLCSQCNCCSKEQVKQVESLDQKVTHSTTIY